MTASRSAALVLAMLLIGGAGAGQNAFAQSGNGLYEPFPDVAIKKRAQRYVDRLRERTPALGRRYSDAELQAGVFVPHDPRGAPALRSSTARAPRGAAGARAGAGDAAELALPVQMLLLVAAVALPAAAMIRRAGTGAA